MKYLKITNKGEVCVEAFSLVGASSKRGDSSKIGMFGSGNKYAISYLLRNSYELIINSGTEKIDFELNKKEFRGEELNVINIKGKETSLTTEMGHKWKLWQAVRELYTNAIDEGLVYFGIVDSVEGLKEGETSVYISMNFELEDFMMNIEEYFIIDREPLFECSHGAIYRKSGNKARVYRRGIRCYDYDGDSLFDYDLNNLDINEDRMVNYSWEVPQEIWNILYSCDNEYIIRKVMNGINENALIENAHGTSYAQEDKLSDTWKELLKGKQVFSKNMAGWLSSEELLKTILLPSWLYSTLLDKIGDIIKPKSLQFSENGLIYEEVELNDLRAKILSNAMDFFTDSKFHFDYKVKVVDFKKTDILGSIDKENNTVLIDIKTIDKGKDEVVNTIIEEYIHLKHGVADETRGFQTAVITELVNYMKSKI